LEKICGEALERAKEGKLGKRRKKRRAKCTADRQSWTSRAPNEIGEKQKGKLEASKESRAVRRGTHFFRRGWGRQEREINP